MGSFVFFTIINNWLSNEIYSFQSDLLTHMTMLISGVALISLTIWIMFHGYRTVTGQSQQSLMALVSDSLRAVVVVMVATSMGAGSSQLYWTLTDGTSTAIVQLITDSKTGPFQKIDDNLAYMQLGLSTIDTIEDGGNSNIASDLARDKWMSGLGIAGPAVVAGSLLLLNKIALALFIGFGPLFILCLLFKQTASLFQKWLLYGVGTVFSLAVLSIMVTISMKMLAAVTATYIAKYVASMATSGIAGGALSADGLNSMALQQGGIGLILTTLIISAPPMAASFFQGTLGQFQSFSPFGRVGEGSPIQRSQVTSNLHGGTDVNSRRSNPKDPDADRFEKATTYFGNRDGASKTPGSFGPGIYGQANGSARAGSTL